MSNRPLEPIDPLALNPGIRRLVAWLRQQGFQTCDSSDGAVHEHECDLGNPYVNMTVEPIDLAEEADRLMALLNLAGVSIAPVGSMLDPDLASTAPLRLGAEIQATYDPANGIATISLWYIADRHLPSDEALRNLRFDHERQ